MNMTEMRDSYGTRLKPKNGAASVIRAINDRAMLEDYYVYSENKHASVMNRLNIPGMSESWKEHLRADTTGAYDWFEKPLKNPKLSELRDRLLAFCGDSVCLAFEEPDIDIILERGQFWFGHNAKRMEGRDCKCHSNACNLYRQNRETTRICTGYALSKDGMWRQHSWLIFKKSRSNQIIETTEPRVLYYGVALTEEECSLFCRENDW